MTRDKRTYIKVHDGLPDHPKVGRLDDDQAAWLYVALMCWCSRHRTNGNVPKPVAHRMTKGASPARCRKLVTVGLLEDKGDEYEVHDYLEHQRSKEQIEAIANKRQHAGKRGGRPKARGEPNGKQIGLQDESNVKPNGKAAGTHISEVPNGTQSEVLPKTTSSGASADEPETAGPVVAAYVEASENAGRGRPTSALVKKVGRDAKRLLEVDHIPLERLVLAARHVGAGGWANLDVGLQRTTEMSSGHDPSLPPNAYAWDV